MKKLLCGVLLSTVSIAAENDFQFIVKKPVHSYCFVEQNSNSKFYNKHALPKKYRYVKCPIKEAKDHTPKTKK